MSVRAKVVCSSVTEFQDGAEHVKLHAANGKNGTANAQWAKWTPGGSLELAISNPDAQGRILPGRYYFIDIDETTEDA